MAIINYMPPARDVPAGRMVLEQVDLFIGDNETRSTGVVPADLQLVTHAGPNVLAWTLGSGVGIPDVRVAAGKVYWTEFSPGYYNIRFFPNVVGLWRVILTYPAFNQARSFTYNVVAPGAGTPGIGFKASFVKR